MVKERSLKINLSNLMIALGFSLLFIATNIFDWDFFLTTLEIDLRSIVIEGSLPTWSYQMCGGSSRIADPQSYGNSILMILPIVFGSFWGAKLILFFSTWLGVTYFKRILKTVNDSVSEKELNLYSVYLLLSNFFLFHFSNGHLSFSSVFFAFPLLELCLRLTLSKVITRQEWIINGLCLFVLMSGAFYQAAIYFIMPLALAYILYILLDRELLSKRGLWLLIASSLVALLLSAYRWLPVVRYQQEFSRTLDTTEWNNLHHIFFYFFTPVSGRGYLLPVPQNSFFGAAEDSFFGAIQFVLLALIIGRFQMCLAYFRAGGKTLKFSLCLMLVGIILSAGTFHQFSPYALINHIFSNSIRAVGRFNLITLIGLFVLTLDLLKYLNLSRRWKRWLHLGSLLISFSCLFQHYSKDDFLLSLYQTKQILELESSYPDKMQMVHVTKSRNISQSYMYFPTSLGLAVANCYQPMTRSSYLMRETYMEKHPIMTMHFMEDEEQPDKCLQNSFFTQSELFIDSSCKKGTRVKLNMIKDEDLSEFNIVATDKGYILK